jgi:hypothetical protein
VGGSFFKLQDRVLDELLCSLCPLLCVGLFPVYATSSTHAACVVVLLSLCLSIISHTHSLTHTHTRTQTHNTTNNNNDDDDDDNTNTNKKNKNKNQNDNKNKIQNENGSQCPLFSLVLWYIQHLFIFPTLALAARCERWEYEQMLDEHSFSRTSSRRLKAHTNADAMMANVLGRNHVLCGPQVLFVAPSLTPQHHLR